MSPSWRELLIAALVLLAAARAFAASTDIVVLANGDRITGEVKDLLGGRLRYKTDDMGTIDVEWLKIDELSSITVYEVETVDARRFVGTLEARGGAVLAVVGTDGTELLPHDQVVRITRLDTGFWRRLEGSFDLGLTYTQADRTSQLNFDLEIDQRRPNHQTSIDVSGILTDRQDVDATRRLDASLAHLRLRRSKWFTLFAAQAQSNEELGLDLRVLAGAGVGRTAIQTNRTLLRGSVGLAAVEEVPTQGASDEEIEAVLGGTYSFFTFDYPSTNVALSLAAFRALSGNGGLRLEADLSVRRELVKDFYFSVGAYDSFDSDPIVATAEENDWGLTTSIGWSF